MTPPPVARSPFCAPLPCHRYMCWQADEIQGQTPKSMSDPRPDPTLKGPQVWGERRAPGVGGAQGPRCWHSPQGVPICKLDGSLYRGSDGTCVARMPCSLHPMWLACHVARILCGLHGVWLAWRVACRPSGDAHAVVCCRAGTGCEGVLKRAPWCYALHVRHDMTGTLVLWHGLHPAAAVEHLSADTTPYF